MNDQVKTEQSNEAHISPSELNAGLGAWNSTGIVTLQDFKLPDDETPVLLLFYNWNIRIGELRWERPGYEDTFKAFQYWDDPDNDGQEWDWGDVIGWMPLPEAPNV
jgi:hypothetical protein